MGDYREQISAIADLEDKEWVAYKISTRYGRKVISSTVSLELLRAASHFNVIDEIRKTHHVKLGAPDDCELQVQTDIDMMARGVDPDDVRRPV